MTNQMNALFSALSDPTRRAVVERLSRGACSVSQLHGPHNMALPTFLRHLRVLEDTGLVRSAKKGRVRMVTLSPEPLSQMEDWLTRHRQSWATRLDRLETLATQMERTKS